MPSQRCCFSGGIIPCEYAINFLVTSTIQKVHTKSQTTSIPISFQVWMIHYMAQYTTNPSPTIISTITPFNTESILPNTGIKSDGTHQWNRKQWTDVTCQTIETPAKPPPRKMSSRQETKQTTLSSKLVKEPTRIAAMISELRAHEKNACFAQCPMHTRSATELVVTMAPRLVMPNVTGTEISKNDRMFISPITHNTHMNHQNSRRNNPSGKLSDRESSHADCHLTSDMQTKANMLHKTVRSWNYVPHHTPIPKQIMVTVQRVTHKTVLITKKPWDWALSVNITRENKKMNAQTSEVERKLNTSKSDWLGAKLCLHRACSRIQ